MARGAGRGGRGAKAGASGAAVPPKSAPPKPARSKGALSKDALPKGARRTTPSPETLLALGPERLAALVLGESARNPAFRKLVSAALAARQGPEAVAAMVDRRLTALEGARGFIDWQKRRAFAADLDATVTVIVGELRPLDAGAALDRLRRFLGGAGAVLDRVDDGAGSVQAVYERAGAAVVALIADLPEADAAGAAAGLVAGFAADPFGILAGLLRDLIATLPGAALAAVDAALARAAASKADPGDHRREAVRRQALRLRQAVADRRGDPDAFLALGEQIDPGRSDGLAAAARLLAAGRAAEALDWIRRPRAPGARLLTRADLVAGFDARGPERERRRLEIEILDVLGRGPEAQALRWSHFAADLDAPMLRDFLAKLPDFEDDEALIRALDHAQSFADPYRALAFLVAWPDATRAARLVAARAEAWRGERYDALAPAADALAPDHPRAAALLYRRLLDAILRAGHSAAYGHGARYLRELDALAPRLEPGALDPEPAAYYEALRRDHGRKRAFWALVDER